MHAALTVVLCCAQLSKGGKDDASSFSFDNKLDKKAGGSILDSARDHSDSSSKRSGESSAHA